MSKILKALFPKKEVIFEKEEIVKESVNYIVDTYDDETYIYYTTDRREPIGIVDAMELKAHIESDILNTYKFTKEAYAQCEEYFRAINKKVVVA